MIYVKKEETWICGVCVIECKRERERERESTDRIMVLTGTVGIVVLGEHGFAANPLAWNFSHPQKPKTQTLRICVVLCCVVLISN